MTRLWILLFLGLGLAGLLNAQCDCNGMLSCVKDEVGDMKEKMKEKMKGKIMGMVRRLVNENTILPDCDNPEDTDDEMVGYLCNSCKNDFEKVKSSLAGHKEKMKTCMEQELGDDMPQILMGLKTEIESAMENCEKPDLDFLKEQGAEGCQKAQDCVSKLPAPMVDIMQNKIDERLPDIVRSKCKGKGKGKEKGKSGEGKEKGKFGEFKGKLARLEMGGGKGKFFEKMKQMCGMPDGMDEDEMEGAPKGLKCMKEKFKGLKMGGKIEGMNDLMECMAEQKEGKCNEMVEKMMTAKEKCVGGNGCKTINMIGAKMNAMKGMKEKMGPCKEAISKPLGKLMMTACRCFAETIGEDKDFCSCAEEGM